MRKLKKPANLGFCLVVSFFAGFMQRPAWAENTTANLNVSLEITAGCSIGFGANGDGEAGAVNFGSFINLNTAQSAQIALTIRCNGGSSLKYNIGLDQGKNATSDYKNRNLAANIDGTVRLIAYNIYRDSAYSQLWGPIGSDDVLGPVTYPDNADSDTHQVYLLVPPKTGETLYPGTYTDTVIATINWS
ncbi:MAG: SCPU domain-containing protein [Candidatus Tokpelaia sp.]|nr:MAG: SCPU domain-containing protein [Candidatus Tokpelaia sp.]KAA6206974.1 MAG: SCPU domain-containing protein [Candidatus Tokpelaia sp.]